MTLLPGWNSLDAVGSIAHSLHIAAMVVLALLVVAEGMAFIYDDRKYALIGVVERDISARRDQDQRVAQERHRYEIAELQQRLDESQEASRRLTTTDQQTLAIALSAFPGQQIDIASILGDPEGQQFANDFASVVQQAGWDSIGANKAAFTTNPIGVEVQYREPPPDNLPPPALTALVDTLVTLHVLPARSVTICEDVAQSVIRLVVGSKPVDPYLHSSLSPAEPRSISSDSDAANGTTTIETPGP